MKAYVYFASISLLAGCAYGSLEGADHSHPFGKDAGSTTKDAALHDSAPPPPQEASVVDDASIDPPDVTTSTCTLTLPTGLPACDTCLGANCCSEDVTCGNDQECAAAIDCINQCFPTDGGSPDQTCLDACSTQYPNGYTELANLEQCMQTSCTTDCQ